MFKTLVGYAVDFIPEATVIRLIEYLFKLAILYWGLNLLGAGFIRFSLPQAFGLSMLIWLAQHSAVLVIKDSGLGRRP